MVSAQNEVKYMELTEKLVNATRAVAEQLHISNQISQQHLALAMGNMQQVDFSSLPEDAQAAMLKQFRGEGNVEAPKEDLSPDTVAEAEAGAQDAGVETL